MGTKEKLIVRFKTLPKDFTFDEVTKMLKNFGYEHSNKGKTSGSRVVFIHHQTKHPIMLHKPHPSNVIKGYAMKQLLDELEKVNLIKK